MRPPFLVHSGAIPSPSKHVPSGRMPCQEGTTIVTPLGSSCGFGLPLLPYVRCPTTVHSLACFIISTKETLLLITW